MKTNVCPASVRVAGILLLCGFSLGAAPISSVAPVRASQANAAVTTETIVMIRHGEKTAQEYGQLSDKGLNRALALPGILVGKYGKPDFLFAPNPSKTIHSKTEDKNYSYVRPLATIEPTAIKLGMPVNTQYGFTEIAPLEAELAQPAYANATVFVAWEHAYLDTFAKKVFKDSGGDDATVPKWPGSDYDTIFVLRIQRSAGKVTATFAIDHEGLNDKLSINSPSPAAP